MREDAMCGAVEIVPVPQKLEVPSVIRRAYVNLEEEICKVLENTLAFSFIIWERNQCASAIEKVRNHAKLHGIEAAIRELAHNPANFGTVKNNLGDSMAAYRAAADGRTKLEQAYATFGKAVAKAMA